MVHLYQDWLLYLLQKKEIDELIKKETAKEKHEKDNLIDELAIKEVRMPKHDYSLSYSNGKNVNVSFNDLVNTLSVEELKVLKNISSTNDKKRFIKANEDDLLFKTTLKFLLDPYVVTNISKKKKGILTKPSETGLAGRGEAAERKSFPPQREANDVQLAATKMGV